MDSELTSLLTLSLLRSLSHLTLHCAEHLLYHQRPTVCAAECVFTGHSSCFEMYNKDFFFNKNEDTCILLCQTLLLHLITI